MTIQVKAHFNKMTKDSKKELVQFYLKGEAEQAEGLQELCREIVRISVNGLSSLTAEFKKTSKDSNKTAIEFIVNPGAANEHKKEYYALVGKDIELSIEGTNEDPETFKENLKKYEEGLKKENDDKANEDPNQLTIDDELKKQVEQQEGQQDEQQDKEQDEQKQDDDSNDDLF